MCEKLIYCQVAIINPNKKHAFDVLLFKSIPLILDLILVIELHKNTSECPTINKAAKNEIFWQDIFNKEQDKQFCLHILLHIYIYIYIKRPTTHITKLYFYYELYVQYLYMAKPTVSRYVCCKWCMQMVNGVCMV